MKFYFMILFCVNSEKMIRNGNIPSCKNCKYYKPEFYSNSFISDFSKCEKTGTKDIYTDIIKYDFAELSRKDENLCGFKGRYFEPEKNLIGKMIKYEFIKVIPYFIIFSFYLLILVKIYDH